ncbi:profilin-like [Convolutriloba macropyga]|uniref:profilin-like n=1 Tax=Convolutriloba macropyga TaxID=536237 RepID=UPI003F527B5C
MSWDSYIDTVIGYSVDESGNQHVDKVCIIGREGTKWTTDEHPSAIKIQADEINAIVKAFENKDFSAFQTGGVTVEGVCYRFLRSEDDLVLAKQKDQGALVVQCSKSAIVIAHMPEGRQQGKTNHAVARVVEYLLSVDM